MTRLQIFIHTLHLALLATIISAPLAAPRLLFASSRDVWPLTLMWLLEVTCFGWLPLLFGHHRYLAKDPRTEPLHALSYSQLARFFLPDLARRTAATSAALTLGLLFAAAFEFWLPALVALAFAFVLWCPGPDVAAKRPERDILYGCPFPNDIERQVDQWRAHRVPSAAYGVPFDAPPARDHDSTALPAPPPEGE